MLFADGKAVWSWHPLLVSSQWRLVGPTGLLDQPYSLTTVTRRIRSPGRARNKPLKPLRRECRVFRGTCGDYARVLYLFRTRGCGCNAHPAFPCALSLGQTVHATTRAHSRRGIVEPRSVVIARSEATKQSTLLCLRYRLLRGACHRARIRTTRWLAMTVSSGSLKLNLRARELVFTSPLWERSDRLDNVETIRVRVPSYR
jgi:hypothetical protein